MPGVEVLRPYQDFSYGDGDAQDVRRASAPKAFVHSAANKTIARRGRRSGDSPLHGQADRANFLHELGELIRVERLHAV